MGSATAKSRTVGEKRSPWKLALFKKLIQRGVSTPAASGTGRAKKMSPLQLTPNLMESEQQGREYAAMSFQLRPRERFVMHSHLHFLWSTALTLHNQLIAIDFKKTKRPVPCFTYIFAGSLHFPQYTF